MSKRSTSCFIFLSKCTCLSSQIIRPVLESVFSQHFIMNQSSCVATHLWVTRKKEIMEERLSFKPSPYWIQEDGAYHLSSPSPSRPTRKPKLCATRSNGLGGERRTQARSDATTTTQKMKRDTHARQQTRDKFPGKRSKHSCKSTERERERDCTRKCKKIKKKIKHKHTCDTSAHT